MINKRRVNLANILRDISVVILQSIILLCFEEF